MGWLDHRSKRGKHKWLRTQIREEIIASQSVAIALELAKQTLYQNQEEKKPLTVSLREHLGKMVDKIDPLKLMALMGLTVSLKTIWDSSEELLKAWSETWRIAKIDEPKKIILHLSAEYASQQAKGKATELHLPFLDTNLSEMEIAEWMICFSASYLIVEHPEILNMGITTILKAFI